MCSLFRQQRGRRQAGLGVDLQQDEAARLAGGVVVAEVRAGGAATAQRAMRGQSHVERLGIDVGMDRGRDDMARPALGILRLVVVEVAVRRSDLGHRQGALAHHGHGQLTAGDEFFHHRLRPIAPGGGHAGAAIAALAHDLHADRGALVDRLDDIRQRHRVGVFQGGDIDHAAMGDRQAGSGEDGFGGGFIHRQGGGAHAGVGVRNAEPVEHALDRAILAEAAMQRVEHGIGARVEGAQHRAKVAADLDRHHIVAGFAQSDDDLAPAGQADLAFGGHAAIEHCNPGHAALSVVFPSAGTPIRRISQCSSTPLMARTRRRTSLPRSSISADVAVPVLIRKLQCF